MKVKYDIIREELIIKGTLLSIISLILLAVSFAMITAVFCDYFGVYIPIVAYLIPKEYRYNPEFSYKPAPPVYVKEEVIIINKNDK